MKRAFEGAAKDALDADGGERGGEALGFGAAFVVEVDVGEAAGEEGFG